MRIVAAVFGAGFAIAVGFIIFHMFYVETYKDAVIALGQNFVRQNYSECITAMSGFSDPFFQKSKMPVKTTEFAEKRHIFKADAPNTECLTTKSGYYRPLY